MPLMMTCNPRKHITRVYTFIAQKGLQYIHCFAHIASQHKNTIREIWNIELLNITQTCRLKNSCSYAWRSRCLNRIKCARIPLEEMPVRDGEEVGRAWRAFRKQCMSTLSKTHREETTGWKHSKLQQYLNMVGQGHEEP